MSDLDLDVKSHPRFSKNLDGGSTLRIAIVHARWNKAVIDTLIEGAVRKIKESGVVDQNIVIQSVPGSYELPLACQRCAHSIPLTTPATPSEFLP
jgi:6,7-dimethyl-8-ribityllumazine synthase